MKKLLIVLLLIGCGQQISGPPGPQGLPGINASQITIVLFCLGNTTYPTTFNEIGFCINSQVYAVYSANDGFLTLVPPGNYSSNAINSSCNFIVYPNCVIGGN